MANILNGTTYLAPATAGALTWTGTYWQLNVTTHTDVRLAETPWGSNPIASEDFIDGYYRIFDVGTGTPSGSYIWSSGTSGFTGSTQGSHFNNNIHPGKRHYHRLDKILGKLYYNTGTNCQREKRIYGSRTSN